jgi:large subunit ribosomal protein L21
MYAVFSTGGKQYRAATGDVIKVEKLEAEKGATIELEEVLLVGEGGDVKVGTPLVKGGKVMARVVEHGRGDKVNIIKFKRRKKYLKRQGHRQHYTMLEITGIEGAGAAKKTASKKAAPKKEAEEAKASEKATPEKAAPKKAAPKKAAPKKDDKAGTKAAAGKEAKAQDADDGKGDEA